VSESAPSFKRGDHVGKWELDKEIGKGGQGSVWQVRPLAKVKNRPVHAMKLCTEGADLGRARFENEVAILRELEVQGCPRVLDSDVSWTEAYAYYVMELARPLDPVQFKRAPQRALEVLRELLATLAHLHERSIFHRDIKPANLMMATEPIRLLLTDCGIARQADGDGLTRTGEVVGSQHYRAPEIVYGAEATAASEVYGAGRVMEWLFSGQDPSSMTPVRIGGPPGISKRLAARLNEVMDKACAMNASERYQSAKEFLDALPEVWVDLAAMQASAEARAEPLAADRALAIIDAKSEVRWRQEMIPLRQQMQQRLVNWRQKVDLDARYLERPPSETLTEFVADVGELWSWPVLASLHGFPVDAARTALNDMLEVQPWKQSGTTAIILFPRTAAWALQNLCGAAAASSGNVEAVASQLQSPLPNERAALVPLITQDDLTVYPSWIGHVTDAWRTAQSFGDVAWVSNVFGAASQYRDALVAYTWAAAVGELAQGLRAGTVDRHASRTAVVVCATDADLNERGMRRMFGARGALDRFATAFGVRAEELRDSWPTWCEVLCEGRLRGAQSPYHFSTALPGLPAQ
jgi:hypothetical protein